jgi:hypothetical protein
MKIFLLTGILLFAFFGLSSCNNEDVIDVDLKPGINLLVVDGWITDKNEPSVIYLTRSGSYFENTPAPPVSGAILTVADNEGNKETLRESKPGKYVTQALRGKIGHTYTLSIQVDGEEYTASTQLRRVPVIDSLRITYDEGEFTEEEEKENGWTGLKDEREGYYLYYYGPEPEGMGDNYRFKIYQNDVMRSRPEDMVFVNDEYIDGKYLRDIKLNSRPIKSTEHLRVEIWSIDQETYQYYFELLPQIVNGGLLTVPPANVRSNIKNSNPNGKKALGWFGSSAVSVINVTVPQ